MQYLVEKNHKEENLSDNNNLRGLDSMEQFSIARLWKLLDSMQDKLTNIDSQLKEVVRLEERVNSHDQVLSRYGNRLDSHDLRLRDSELWQANHGDRATMEKIINSIQEDVKAVSAKVDHIESQLDIGKGHKDITKEVLKWLTGILSAVIIVIITRG